ncbi:hypothetical protein Pcinc_006057 [Petrolisthes cinctipes]|uniref:2-C-methyl-D-erythritol 4-phosphate cytidylyltransferase n=1 Tax=Petrolisthes cinctipes TaxID=88211 RepID=A0AAE1GDR8_PETCI|nr:hypothetical protein Pcinc_006057 [Petrolisthes cinctipes]
MVCGKPLILHSLLIFEKVFWIRRIVVVADDVQRMRSVITKAALTKVFVIQGGASRHRSIRSGVEALTTLGSPLPNIVLVHDAVRPIIPYTILAKVAVNAEIHGASGVVRPLVSTVVRPDSKGFLSESLIRSQYANSEMPQAFSFSVLRDAYMRCSEDELDHGTECLALVLREGIRAKLVPGSPLLWKVTEEKDLVLARSILPKHSRSIIVLCRSVTKSVCAEEEKKEESEKKGEEEREKKGEEEEEREKKGGGREEGEGRREREEFERKERRERERGEKEERWTHTHTPK